MANYSVLDVSKYNAISDYNLASSAIDGVLIRVGYRGYGTSGTLTVDSLFKKHYEGFAGKTKIGFYWFSQAINIDEIKAEALFVYNQIKDLQCDFPIYFDSEYANSNHTGRADSLTVDNRSALIAEFCREIRTYGYRSGVYASDSWYKNNIHTAALINLNVVDSFWVARYSSNPPEFMEQFGYDGWQYTSSGSIPGYAGNVDMSHFYNDIANWEQSREEDINNTNINTLEVRISQTEYMYTGNANCPTITIPGLTQNTDYEVEYENNIDAGTGVAIVSGIGIYSGKVYKEFTIYPISILDKYIVIKDNDHTYTGLPQTPEVSIVGLTKDVDYEVFYENNINVGTAVIYCEGINNYVGSLRTHFVITPKSISNMTAYADPYKYKYTGLTVEANIKITGLTKDRDYTVTYVNNINIGTNAKAICTGIRNYTGTTECTFEISICDITEYEDKVTLNPSEFVYNGSYCKPIVTIEELTEGEDFEVSYRNNLHAGTATVVIDGINNYINSINKKFNIQKQSVTQNRQFSIEQDIYKYTGAAITPKVIISGVGITQNKDYTIKYQNNKLPGDATVLINGINDYTGNYTIPFTIQFTTLDECTATLGTKSEMTPWQLDGPFVIKYGNRTLVENKDYEITSNERDHRSLYDIVTITVQGLAGFTGEKTYTYQVIEQEPLTPVIDDDGVYNYGDIDLGDETAEGMYDIGDLDEGVDPDNIAHGDYDFNKFAGDEDDPDHGKFVPGSMYELKDVPIYAHWSSSIASDIKSGLYYIYNGTVKGGRIRMCSTEAAVEMPCRITGWVNTADLLTTGGFKEGDHVIVNGKLYKDYTGEGGYTELENKFMYINKIEDLSNEYPFAISSEPRSSALGYTNKDSLELVTE